MEVSTLRQQGLGCIDLCGSGFSPAAESMRLVSSIETKEGEGLGVWSPFMDVSIDDLRHSSTCRTEGRLTGDISPTGCGGE